MIYKKDVNFPYPILTNSNNSYEDCYFNLDIHLSENKKTYDIRIDYEVECYFINLLLLQNKARLYLIVQSVDSKFFELKFNDKKISISKNRLSLSKKSQMQLMIKSNEDISFKGNNELSGIYKELKDEILVLRNSVLAFSNVVTFEGSYRKNLNLFEKRIDPELESEIKIDLSSETIIISYKNAKTQFNDILGDESLNNMYIYMGLQRALDEFISNNRINDDENEIIISEISEPELELDNKLFKLMRNKMIQELNTDNIDKVIHLISDGIIESFVTSIRGCINDRN